MADGVSQLRVQPAAQMMISLSVRRCCAHGLRAADGFRLGKTGKLCNAGAVQLLR